MGAYPTELRTRVVAAVEQGDLTIGEVARVFNVGLTFVKKKLRWQRAGEDRAPRHGGGPEPALKDHDLTLRRVEIKAHPDAMLVECQHVMAERGTGSVSLPTIGRAL